MWQQHQENKAIYAKIKNASPRKREQMETSHRAELILFNAAEQYLKELKSNSEPITPKKWVHKVSILSTKKDKLYQEMYAMRDSIKTIEQLRKADHQLTNTKKNMLRNR